jgi:myo-inositol-1(or 4)-monophosphatase
MPVSSPPLDDPALLAVASRAARAGGAVLRQHWGQLRNIRSKGRPGDLVTEADLAAEAAVLAELRASTPAIGILAEESGRLGPADGALQWCVDPLDGTTNYAHGHPLFGCSVGLLRDGVPVLGAIDAPALNEHYAGGPGLGARCNDDELQVSGCRSLADSLLVTGFAYDRCEREDNNYAEFCHFTHVTRGVRRGGAASLDLAFVAAGRLDGYWERGLQPWDLAAGVALVLAAGGDVCAYDGGPLDLMDGRVVAVTPALRQPLLAGLAQCHPLPPATYLPVAP